MEALRQVGWLHQSQSFHRLRACYWPKFLQIQNFPSAQSFHKFRVFRQLKASSRECHSRALSSLALSSRVLLSIQWLIVFLSRVHISNNPSFRQEHPGVPGGTVGSDGTSHPLTENYTRPVAQATGRVAYLPCGGYYTTSLIFVMRHVVYYLDAHPPRSPPRRRASFTLRPECGDVHAPSERHVCYTLSPAECHILPLRHCYLSDAALSPYMFSFEMLSLITIQSSLLIHRLPLHLLRHYRILQVWNILSNLHIGKSVNRLYAALRAAHSKIPVDPCATRSL